MIFKLPSPPCIMIWKINCPMLLISKQTEITGPMKGLTLSPSPVFSPSESARHYSE